MSNMMKNRNVAPLVFASLWLAFGSGAQATTLLTSGVPVTFGLPSASSPTLFNGGIGYAIYVPPGAQKLTIRYYLLTPGQVTEVLVRAGADVGRNGVGTIVRDYVLTDCEKLITTSGPNPWETPPRYSLDC